VCFFVGVHDDLVEGSDLIVGLNLLVVDEDHAGLQRFLDLVTGGVLDALDQEFVDAQGLLTFIHFQAESLVQLIGPVC
jgi:hypothetical protein